jgi:repressor LexA
MGSRRLLALRAVFGYTFFGIFSVDSRAEPAMPLTRRQKQILDFLETYIRTKGYAPSFEEIAERFSYSSLATVHEHLTNLEAKGCIRRTHNESRAIELVPAPGQTGATELPLLGQVAAGEPIEAIAEPESIAVPNDLLPRRGSSYVLRVRGDSMIDEHIQDGDYVVVHNRDAADNGQMVIALVQGTSATVKRLYRESDGWIRLQPSNARMQPFRVHEDDLLIQGIVVGVIRKY